MKFLSLLLLLYLSKNLLAHENSFDALYKIYLLEEDSKLNRNFSIKLESLSKINLDKDVKKNIISTHIVFELRSENLTKRRKISIDQLRKQNLEVNVKSNFIKFGKVFKINTKNHQDILVFKMGDEFINIPLSKDETIKLLAFLKYIKTSTKLDIEKIQP